MWGATETGRAKGKEWETYKGTVSHILPVAPKFIALYRLIAKIEKN
jgi:hypothetical protein